MSNQPAHERWWWNASDGRYFDFAEAMPSAGTLPLIALSGARSDVDEAAAAAHVATVEQVLAGLLPELRAALERMKGSVATLDPALVVDGPAPDVVAVAERLVRELDRGGESHVPTTVGAIADDLAVVMRTLAFGSIAEHLVAALGVPAAGGSADATGFAWLGEREAASAMIARVRLQVRSELDAHSAVRPIRSFEFKELIKPPRPT